VDDSTGQNDPMRALTRICCQRIENLTTILNAMMEGSKNAAEENAVFKEEIQKKWTIYKAC
jgi:hypothetical protein